MTLNAQQLSAVACVSHSCLVNAGAGTGKTTVLIERAAYLIRNNVSPSNILCVTFTNKAANEMRERLDATVGEDAAKRVFIGTFHALGLHMLNEWPTLSPTGKGFSILTEADTIDLTHDILDGDTTLKSKLKPNRATGALGLNDTPANEHEAKVRAAYLDTLTSLGAVDYDRVLTNALALLSMPRVSDAYRKQYRHVLVDEFQDTDDTQLAWLVTLNPYNLFLVGDDRQAIYQWRTGKASRLLEARRLWPDLSVFNLEQTYRFGPRIAAASERLIALACDLSPKKLLPVGSIEDKIVVETYDGHLKNEPEKCASETIFPAIESGVRPCDIAILLRTNSLCKLFHDQLPDLTHYAAAQAEYWKGEIQSLVLDMARAYMDPLDSLAVERIVRNYLSRYSDYKGRVSRCRVEALRAGMPLLCALTVEFAEDELMCFLGDSLGVGVERKRRRSALEFVGELDNISDTELVIEAGNVALDIARHEKNPDDVTLHDFVRWCAMNPSGAARTVPEDRVQIMTIHQAKGLEFDTVLLPAFRTGIIPNPRSDFEEERRLAYVAMTRAKRRLIISWSQNPQSDFRGSPFVKDMFSSEDIGR